MRLTGSKAEIEYTLSVLEVKGFSWESNGKYYPRRGETAKFSYLNDVIAPPAIAAPPTVPPTPYDAVLGGKMKSELI